MPRPGVDVQITETAPVGGAILDSGQAFMVGVSERGPTRTPLEVRSLRTFERNTGPRIAGPIAHDAARAFFTEGGSVFWYLRLTGDGATAASGEVGPLGVTASSAGAWGNSVTVALEKDTGAVNGSTGLVRVVVRRDDEVLERSPLVGTAGAVLAWMEFSAYLDVTADDPGATLEEKTPVTLTGGNNGGNVSAATVTSTLNYFTSGYGPGQVCYPGATDAATQGAVLEHCWRMRRFGLIDLADGDAATLAADMSGLWNSEGSQAGQALAPWIRYRGPTAATTITSPYSPIQAGIIARRDRQTGNPNDPAAGVVAGMVGARGLAREFDDDTREQLNEIGVTLAKVIGRPATVVTYGSRTAAGPDETLWRWAGGTRVVWAITHESNAGAEQFVHRQIDPQGRIFIELNTALTAICQRYFALGALYGETSEEAYNVDTSSAVNTPETIANGEIHAHIRVATSPPGEWVLIEITKQLPLAA
jgi:phage tail sheath protein FI